MRCFGVRNRSERERDNIFFRVPKENKRRGERIRRIPKQRRERWLVNL